VTLNLLDTKVVLNLLDTKVVLNLLDTKVVLNLLDTKVVLNLLDTKVVLNLLDTKVVLNLLDTKVVLNPGALGLVSERESGFGSGYKKVFGPNRNSGIQGSFGIRVGIESGLSMGPEGHPRRGHTGISYLPLVP
jgi:hypothetical protein